LPILFEVIYQCVYSYYYKMKPYARLFNPLIEILQTLIKY